MRDRSRDGVYLDDSQMRSLALLCIPHPRSEALLKRTIAPVRQNLLGEPQPAFEISTQMIKTFHILRRKPDPG